MYSVFLFHFGISFALDQFRIAQEKVWWVHDSCRILVRSTGAWQNVPGHGSRAGKADIQKRNPCDTTVGSVNNEANQM